jgi:tyrosinase
MYLYWWERIVRKTSGDPTFAIGYWRYDPSDAASRVLPEPFRQPTSGNPLFSPRNSAVNAGSPIAASAADSHFAMLETTFFAPPSPGFSESLASLPHDVVHGQVGGLMGGVDRAARDPIFWCHHANIDRLWSRWLDDASHANPASGPFLTTVFKFFDEDGKNVSMTGKDVLRTVDQLCYRYDDDPLVTAAAAEARQLRTAPERIVIESKILATLPEPRHTLGRGPSAFRLGLPAAARDAMNAAAASGGKQRVVLAFEDASVKGTPDASYEVYLNLPADQKAPGVGSPHYAGSLGFFSLDEDGEHGRRHGPTTLSLNVTTTIAALLKAQAIQGDNLTVTVVPVQPGVEPGAPIQSEAVPSFRRMVLRVE